MAADRDVMEGYPLELPTFAIFGDKYEFMPLASTYYAIVPRHTMLPIICLGDLGAGSKRGRHDEAREAAYSVVPELRESRTPQLSEAFIEMLKQVLVPDGTFMSFAANTLSRQVITVSLRAYFMGTQA